MADAVKLNYYDSALLNILQSEERIVPFIDVIFGFLYRKTDFYRFLDEKNTKIGFEPGVAEGIVRQAYGKYYQLARQDDAAAAENPPPAEPKIEQPKTAPPKREEQAKEAENEPTAPESSEQKQQQMFQACSESFNGAIRDNYSWSQTITDVDIRVKIPNYIKKGKQMKVDIGSEHLSVSHQSPNGEWVTVMDGKLCWKVNKTNSMWTLVPGDHALLSLEKAQERWWDALLEGEEKINIREINAERPMEDLSYEAQMKIQQMMYDQRRKELGLPTSEEQKVNDVLKKAWDAEGSPFQGTPFDPSRVSMGGNRAPPDQ